MKRKFNYITGLLLAAFLFHCLPQAHAVNIQKEDLKDVAKVGAAAAVISKIKLPKAKPPEAPKSAKLDIPGLPEEKTPSNKKEAKKTAREKRDKATESAQEALQEAQTLASAGDVQAAYILGHAYYTGQQVKADAQLAVKWWQKAVNQGHPEADAYMGLAFAKGLGGLVQSQTEAKRRWRRAAANDSALAAVLLGIAQYKTGIYEEKLQAVKLFEKAARQGNPLAKQFLPVIVKDGVAVNRDFGKGIDWQAQAKKITLAELYTQAGTNAFFGRIVPQNYEQSVMWWEIAAGLGDIKAQALLGTAYYTGRGIGQNYSEAMQLLKTAAAQNDPLAAYTLGKAYLEGNGVKKNKELAGKLFRTAGDQGIAAAAKMADKLEGRN